MLQFDTIKMLLPGSAIDCMVGDKMDYSTLKTQTVISETYVLKGSVPGFKHFTYDVLKDSVTLELSAKILAGDYFRGISLDTLEQTIERVNVAGGGAFSLGSLGDWFSDAKVLRADVCTNVTMQTGDEKQGVLNSIASLPVVGYDRKVWPVSVSSLPQTITFKRELKTKHLQFRQRHYDKFAELRGDKTFLKYLHENGLQQKVMQGAINVVRAESSEVSLAGLKKMLNVQSNDFADVFNSHAKPNFDRFDRMIKTVDSHQLTIFGHVEDCILNGMKRLEYEKLVGRATIYKALNGDFELIRQYLLKFGEKNMSRGLGEYATLANSVVLNDRIPDKAILERYTALLAA
jgi:hypothetical protein